MKKFILIIALVIAWQNNVLAASTESSSQNNKVPEPSNSNNYKCDGRTYCSQMTSCEEAPFLLITVRIPKWMAAGKVKSLMAFRAKNNGVIKNSEYVKNYQAT